MGLSMEHVAESGYFLSDDVIYESLRKGLQGIFTNERVLVLIPDHTRSLPLPLLFRAVVDILEDTLQLDFMVALGTHPPLNDEQMNKLVGISSEERKTTFRHINFINHEWNSSDSLKEIGILSKSQIQEIAGKQWHPTLGEDVPVRINKRIFNYDHILILGPTFPHEVVGFSGGAKYLFPGISGPEMINTTHWLGALGGVKSTIGVKNTPIRRMIDAATEFCAIPITLVALVVVGKHLSGLFIGDHLQAWSKAADLSSQVHIKWCKQPFTSILSHAPVMYDELWTAAKAMYKLESVVSDGGELIIYAPHLKTISHSHGDSIYSIGYHTLPFFLQQWDRYKHVPLGVLAHSTHVKGEGTYCDGIELPRIHVTLSSQISEEDCKILNLGYLDPQKVKPQNWTKQKNTLYVPNAGEILYRLE